MDAGGRPRGSCFLRPGGAKTAAQARGRWGQARGSGGVRGVPRIGTEKRPFLSLWGSSPPPWSPHFFPGRMDPSGERGPLCLSLGSRWGADCLENFSLEFPLWRDGISSVSGVPQCRFNTRPAQRVKVKSCHKSQPRLRSEPWPKNSVCRGTVKKEQASKQVVAWGSAGDLPTHCPSPQGQSGKVLHSHRS